MFEFWSAGTSSLLQNGPQAGAFTEAVRVIWALRFPLTAAVVMLGLPIYAHFRRKEFLVAITSRGWAGTASTVMIAWIDGTIIAITAGIVLRVGALRLGVRTPLDNPMWNFVFAGKAMEFIVPAVVILPTVFVLWKYGKSRVQSTAGSAVGVACGFVISWAVHLYAANFMSQDIGSGASRAFAVGYFKKSGELFAGHLLAAGMLLVLVAIYVIGYFWLHPKRRRERKPPLIFYFWFLLGIFALFLPGMSFFFDYYHVPTLGVLLVVAAITARLFRQDHFFEVGPVDVAKPTVESAIAARTALGPVPGGSGDETDREDWKIFVCAWGGGIQAAAWTTRVLTGLQERFGDRFPRKIAMLSGVSGGSVGLLKWAHGVDRRTGIPHADDLEMICDASVQPSLDEAAWGMAFPDLLRMIFPPAATHLDRAWAVEQAWIRHLDRLSTDMTGDPGGLCPEAARWRRETAAGVLPILAFNTVTVEQGRHIALATAGPLGEGDAVQDLDALYGRDLQPAPVTAARLSATFPVVTPVARARQRGDRDDALPTWHFADGGYFDNGGVYTAVRTASAWLAGGSNRRVLLLEIEGFPEKSRAAPNERFGWIRNTFAPLETMLAMRASAQRERGGTEIGLLSGRFEDRVKRIVLKPAGGEPPLTWHLEPEDVGSIRDEWARVAASPAVERIGALL